MIPLRTYVTGGAVLLALVFGGLWLKSRDDRIRNEGKLVLLQVAYDSARALGDRRIASADSAAARARAERAASDARAAQAEARIAQETRAAAEARQRAEDAILRAPAKADTIVLVSMTADTAAVRRRVNELLAVHAEERRGWQDVIRSDSVTIFELRAVGASRLAALDSAAALDVQRVAEVDALVKRAEAAEAVTTAALKTRPGWFERTGWKIAVPLAAVGGWFLHARVAG